VKAHVDELSSDRIYTLKDRTANLHRINCVWPCPQTYI